MVDPVLPTNRGHECGDEKLMDDEASDRLTLEDWLDGRPAIIHELANRFAPGCVIKLGDDHCPPRKEIGPDTVISITSRPDVYVVGYTEDGGLLVSPWNPRIDYKQAVEHALPLCRECVDQFVWVKAEQGTA